MEGKVMRKWLRMDHGDQKWMEPLFELWENAQHLINNKYLTLRSYKAFKYDSRRESGSARIAINEWLAHYNIRMAQIEVKAGIETKIKILPKYRSASEDIRELDPSVRECLFQDEVEVSEQFWKIIDTFPWNFIDTK